MAIDSRPNRKAFKKRVANAVHDQNLRTALTRALPEFSRRRAAAFDGHDFDGRRKFVHHIKAESIEHLPELIAQFTHEAEAVGSVVHMAETIEDARRIVLEIAAQQESKLIVKSKSMVTEEIQLNASLESAGYEVVETDLGEWIMQLAHEHPSHLIAPAVHKTREQVAELFSVETGRDLPADPAALVAVARERLREAFIAAGIGISGANVAVAETGTLVIVTNEGNERLVATLPPVHIAILGIEKIVPTLEDATAIMQVLPRSGTGQKITSYVSYITGPSRSADIELTLTIGVHGPKELHIILLDNGRWKTRQDPELHEALHCIRCGACSNVCPPYQIVGGHQFGHIYTGPIGLIMTAQHHGLAAAAGPQSLCASCNACELVCPAEIPIPRMILDVRSRVHDELGAPFGKQQALNRWTHATGFSPSMSLATLASGMIADAQGVIRHIPGQPELTEGRALFGPARKPLRDRIKPQLSNPDRPTLTYFPGCITDRILPDMGEAVLAVIKAASWNIEFPRDQHCCGLVALNAGDRHNGRIMAEQTIRMLEQTGTGPLMTSSTSCLAAMLQDYQHLFRSDRDWRERAAIQASRLVDFTTWVLEYSGLSADDFVHTDTDPTVTVHDACQSHNALGLYREQRAIVADLLQLPLVEMADSTICCGFGGSFAIDHPLVSSAILGKKLANVEAVHPDIVITDNPGCVMQIRGGAIARDAAFRSLHVAELMAERLRD